jgi:hypothetical protein
MMNTRVRLRRLLGRYRLAIEIGLLLIGGLLTMAAYLPDSKGDSLHPLALLLFSLGTSLLATSFASLFLSLAGVDVFTLLHQSLDLSQEAQEMGLKKIHLRFDSGTIIEWLKHATSVDFMADTGRKFLNLCEGELVHAMTTYGANVRILISDKDNSFWEDEDVSKGASPGTKVVSELEETVIRLENLERRLWAIKRKDKRIKRGSLEVRTYRCIPYCSILIVDGSEGRVARHTPYLHYTDSANVPSFDVTGEKDGKLFAIYRGIFEGVWEESDPVFEVNLADDPPPEQTRSSTVDASSSPPRSPDDRQ